MHVTPEELAEEFEEAGRRGRRVRSRLREAFPTMLFASQARDLSDEALLAAASAEAALWRSTVSRVEPPPRAPKRHRPPAPRRTPYLYTYTTECEACGHTIEHRVGNRYGIHVGAGMAGCPGRRERAA